MKKSLIALLFSLGFTSASYAQTPCMPPAPDWNRLAERLGLETQQFDAFVTVMTAEHSKREALRKTTHDDMKTGMDAIDQETITSLANVLTEDQLAAFESLQSDMRRHRPGPPPPGDMNRPAQRRGQPPPQDNQCQPSPNVPPQNDNAGA